MSVEFDFWLDRDAPAPQPFEYRPWSTRSVRIVVRGDRNMGPIRIRPTAVLPTDLAVGRIWGYEDGVAEPDGGSFVVSWGGGHEPGPAAQTAEVLGAFEKIVDFTGEQTTTIIYNLSHIGPLVPEQARLTFIAFREGEPETAVAQLPLILTCPALPAAQTTHFVREGDAWHLTEGGYLPLYDYRWWPAETVEYQPVEAHPPLTARTRHNRLQLYWNQQLIAELGDHTAPSLLDPEFADKGRIQFEIFHFDEYHYAVRLWFFWLDTTLGGQRFLQRHEVPDVERFDFLVRARDGLVTMACTDLHWREVWGVLLETPLTATIGLTPSTKATLIKQTADKWWQKIWGQEKHAGSGSLYISLVERKAKQLGRADEPFVVRDKGAEAHVPMIENWDTGNDRYTSNDVRLGR